MKTTIQKIGASLIALFFGLIGVFAFSPYHYWPLAYVSLFALLYFATQSSGKKALWYSFLWGMGFFTFGVSWLHISIAQFGGAPLFLSWLLVGLLAGYLSLFPTLFAYLVQRFQVKSPAIFPALWTLTEWLRGHLFSGFPWLQLGYTQIDSPFYGLAPLFGVQGLTFFVMWASAVLFTLWRYWRQGGKSKLFGASYLLLLSVTSLLAYYSSQLTFVKAEPEKALTFALLQGNIPQQMKWDPAYVWRSVNVYQQLIQENIGKADVIVLPESAIPLEETSLSPWLMEMQESAQKAQSSLLLGTVFLNEQGRLLNSIIALNTTPYAPNNVPRYSKQHLVPFGEYVPLENWLRPLGTVFNLPMSAFEKGAGQQANLNLKGQNFAPAICYEIIFPEEVRANWQAKTAYLLTLSNDAWFGASIGPWQHLQMAQMRALELGRPLVRATNNGISVLVNEKGQILQKAPQFTQTALRGKLTPTTGNTPYAVLGSKPLYALIFLLLFLHSTGALLKRAMLKLAPTPKE